MTPSLITSLALARDNARQVREALSNEVWENLNRLYLRLAPVTMDSIWVHHAGAPVPRGAGRNARPGRRDLFHPAAMAKAGTSWSWAGISNGRSCWAGCWISISAGRRDGSQSTPKYFDWLVLLKFCTAFEPYTKHYTASIRPQKIAEFLLFDPEFPHSIRFSVDRVHRCAGACGAGRAAGAPRGGGTAGRAG